jgi:hypothetical protein
MAKNAICEFVTPTPPNVNLVERPQDLSQSLYNFYTLLLRCIDNFPSLLDVEIFILKMSLHPNKHASCIEQSFFLPC